ncbi:cytochrome c oxidase assembly protein [Parvularcula sp. LCG005]|uniref:cytochrome c oxidase assembly protein n=1 Tax=Parvularcula sp. LCG005 TaxID=3078805 RepID=UPI0029436ED9|nr:cytochrome c oxidase assembly protein [Parvularcula sp. LCG005]WOI53980.1 cytochrome c oxidase assembly protein [Parvularcula sp. LCG005]
MGDRNSRTALVIVGVVACMVGLSYAAVPLYKTFCQITGWGGTTQRAVAVSEDVLERKITVRFDGSISNNIPWTFKPSQVSQTMHVGETGLAFYTAANNADYPVIGTASFNVQPAKAGEYFMKVECFCFTEQLLEPGESVQMPVTYFIDPAMDKDKQMDDVREITLSYTFYRNEVAEKKMAAQAAAKVETVAN